MFISVSSSSTSRSFTYLQAELDHNSCERYLQKLLAFSSDMNVVKTIFFFLNIHNGWTVFETKMFKLFWDCHLETLEQNCTLCSLKKFDSRTRSTGILSLPRLVWPSTGETGRRVNENSCILIAVSVASLTWALWTLHSYFSWLTK